MRYLNSSDDGAFLLSANIPLGSKSALSVGQEALSQTQREPWLQAQRKLELTTRLFEIYHELVYAQTAFDVYEKTIIPQAERVLKDSQSGFRAGRYSVLGLYAAQRNLLEARLERVEQLGFNLQEINELFAFAGSQCKDVSGCAVDKSDMIDKQVKACGCYATRSRS